MPPAEAVRRLAEIDDEDDQRRWIERCLVAYEHDEFLPLLKRESERYQNVDPRLALRFAEILTYAGTVVDRPEYHALGMNAIADAFRALGRFAESVEVIEQAGNEYLALGDEVGWARGRITWVIASQRMGRGEMVLAEIDIARDILVKHEVWNKVAIIDLNAANVCRNLGRYDEALIRYDRALDVLSTLGESEERVAAITKTNKAIVLTILGEFQAALRLHEEALPLFVRHGDTVIVARTEWNVAYVHAEQGHFTRALHHFNNARVALEHAGADIDVAWITLYMIECYLSLNHNAEALSIADEAASRFERFGTPTEVARAQFYCALAHARLGDIERALTLFDEVGATFAVTGQRTEQALTVLQRASLFLDDANWSAAFDESERAGRLFAESGLVIRRAQADLVRARAALALGDQAAAAQLAQSVLAVSEQRDVRWLVHEAHHIRGNVAEARGDAATALDAYRDAMTSIEQVQQSLTIELRTNFLADKLRVYEDAIAVSLRLARPEIAFAYLERAKSRALVDYLANHLDIQMRASDGANPELLDTLARLREEHNGLYNRLYGSGLTRRATDAIEVDATSLQAAVQDREKEIARILDRLALERADDVAFGVFGLDAQPTRPRLEENTVLLEYFFQEDGGVIFVVANDRMTVIPLVARPRDISRLLHQWHLNLAATARAITSNAPLTGLDSNARGLLGALARALIGPVAEQIAGYERLVIVPYGPSHAVPFQALTLGERYLFEMMEVSVCPSSSLLQLCSERPRRTAKSSLVIAHSDDGRLPAVLDEARVVADLLPGERYIEGDATRSALIAAAPRHAVLHLAAHGEARLDNPTFAHLKLADGQLSMVDVFNLDLRGALVTLSACETGRSVVTGGDELIGLSRGFLYAGASTLVQSLWRVEDGSTAQFMETFYRGISRGEAKGAALREAQRTLLASNGTHPYFWAPFQLIGDHGRL